MVGNALSFVLAAVLGYVLLRRRIGRLGLTAVFATLGRLTVAALGGGVLALIALIVISGAMGDGKKGSVVALVVGGAVLIAGYVAIALALRVREVRELGSMVRTRLPG
jgi:putative peptidoglycan lipid II flippase